VCDTIRWDTSKFSTSCELCAADLPAISKRRVLLLPVLALEKVLIPVLVSVFAVTGERLVVTTVEDILVVVLELVGEAELAPVAVKEAEAEVNTAPAAAAPVLVVVAVPVEEDVVDTEVLALVLVLVLVVVLAVLLLHPASRILSLCACLCAST
jgi:hypothetical protein